MLTGDLNLGNVEWIVQYRVDEPANYLFKVRGKSVHAGLVDILVNIAGDSVAHLDNEIEKICLLVGDRPRIEVQDIERFSGWRRERQRW